MRTLAAILLFLNIPSYAHAVALYKVTTLKVAHVVGEIDNESAQAFLNEIDATAALPGEQLILVDSPGGSVSAGQAMIDAVEAQKAQGTKVACVVTGMAASMAFNLLTHCDTRIADTGAKLLFHKVALGQMPDIRLSAPNLRHVAELLDKFDAPYSKANMLALGMDESEYNFYADQENWWSAVMMKRLGYLNALGNYAEVVK